MKALFDTNVVLDVLLDRQPFVDNAVKLFSLVDNGHIGGAICATTVTTIFYIASKDFGRKRAREQVHDLLKLFEIAPVDREALEAALLLDFSDFEDAVIHESARAAGVTAIVTRDQKDFLRSEIPVLLPSELLAAVSALK